jgi:hypothetical protein
MLVGRDLYYVMYFGANLGFHRRFEVFFFGCGNRKTNLKSGDIPAAPPGRLLGVIGF